MANETASEIMNVIQTMQLTSDIFFGVVLEDIGACEEVIRILTGAELEIIEVKSQYSILQIDNHSVRIDIIFPVTRTDSTIAVSEKFRRDNKQQIFSKLGKTSEMAKRKKGGTGHYV